MDYRKRFVIEPGTKVWLGKIDPAFKDKHESHDTAKSEIQRHVERMTKLQYLLYATANQSLLVVLQALDAGGKDGVVRHRAPSAPGRRQLRDSQTSPSQSLAGAPPALSH
jgi:polyphosphate kinase 2 (PPK2 family)